MKFTAILTCLVLSLTILTHAQGDEGFIYGKVTTRDNNEYVGQIRWEDEEAFWFDHFNSSKPYNQYVKYLPEEAKQRTQKEEITILDDWKIVINKKHFDGDYDHVFVCRFGDIKKIDVHHGDEVTLTFKNGFEYELEGGSNDIGAEINIMDPELGKVTLDWDRIDEVEFMSTPSRLKKSMGKAIYGTVFTEREGEYEGYIQWDHDERISTDVLDGESRDGDFEIDFGDILTIEKIDDESCEITLKSGHTITLGGTNDVDDGNRGVIINTPGFGRVDVDWDEFVRVEFKQSHSASGPGYDNYKTPERLTGSVVDHNDKLYAGLIVYDLDEIWDFEILQGKRNDVEFLIPFRNIQSITPIFNDVSRIKMRDGRKFELEDSHDVSYENYGIIIMQNEEGKDASYVSFREVDEIVLK